MIATAPPQPDHAIRARQFYNSAAWLRVRAAKVAETPWCEEIPPGQTEPCGQPVQNVHHTIPISTSEGWEKRLDPTLLRSVCIACHNRIEPIRQAGAKEATATPYVCGTLTIVEDETYYFDAEAADLVVDFIETFCVHHEGDFKGQPFRLIDWQKTFVRNLFGWKVRATGLRRFREAYILTSKGAGKTPMLSGIGLFMLLLEGEAAPHVVSMATTFEQANLTFGGGKTFIENSDPLKSLVKIRQYQISTRKGYGKWTTVSGKPNGRSGPRPSCVIGDEVHEWPPMTAKAFEMLTANLFKRSQPIMVLATNAGETKECYAYKLHTRAVGVLAGTIKIPTLLPVIYESPPDVPWDSEAAAAAANPSLGKIVTWGSMQPLLEVARLDPAEEAKYRRLQLSQWVSATGTKKWIDIPTQWTPNVAGFDPAELKDAAIYTAIDLSEGDDLCAVVDVYVTPDRMYVDADFWICRDVAAEYERKHGIPYSRWASEGWITLLDEIIVDSSVRRRIAERVIERKPLLVGYDRAYKASEIVAILAAADIKTVDVPQGWSLSPAVSEINQRMKARTITFSPSPVLQWNAANVELFPDRRGNTWPVKPAANGRYAGTRYAKVDGMTALATAMTEARKHAFPAAQATFKGTVLAINLHDD